MANAQKQLLPEDLERICQRITALEERTDAEVVCAVATESGRFDRAESICGLVVGVFALLLSQQIAARDDWDVTVALPIAWQAGLIVGGFVVGSMVASYWHGLRRLFVSQREMNTEVDRSANLVFAKYGVGGTRHRGGLLIYVSLFEHRLEVLGDRAVTEKVSIKDLEQIRDVVLANIRQGRLADGLIAGLDEAEKRLASALPRSRDVTDELMNEVLVFHPRP